MNSYDSFFKVVVIYGLWSLIWTVKKVLPSIDKNIDVVTFFVSSH